MSFNEYWQAEQKRRAVAEAIAALEPGDKAAHARFYQALKRASLLLPVEALPEGLQNGDLLTGENVPIQVKMVKTKDGKVYLPLFTSRSTLRHSHSEVQPYLQLAFSSVVQMALQAKAAGVVVDRSGPASAIVQLPVLLALSKGQKTGQPTQASGTDTKQKATQIRVGPPPRVIEYREVLALGDWLEQQSGLAQAYLFGLIRGSSQAILTVGLSFSESPEQEEMKEMARELREVLGPSGIILIDGQLATMLARQAGAIRFDLRKIGR
ncbi:MAG: SseB family protein [Chloroflexota bacterium]|nr:SseB family protein [Chloroflexota bacterium]